MRLNARLRLAQRRWHQYRCPHDARHTETWLQDKAVHRKTRCASCGKLVPAYAALDHSELLMLLNRASSLADGARVDV